MAEHNDFYPLSDPFYRTDEDGNIRPFSIKEQWEQVRAWQSYLEKNPEVAGGMLEDWRVMEKHYFSCGHSPPYDWDEHEKADRSILETLFFLADNSFFPPPALLFALMYTFTLYRDNVGKISLEDAFFGKPVKRSGNYAARLVSKRKKERVKWLFVRGLWLGFSRTESAEQVANAPEIELDADSILRMQRNVTLENSSEFIEEFEGNREFFGEN